MSRLAVLVAVLALVLVACSGADDPTADEAPLDGAATPAFPSDASGSPDAATASPGTSGTEAVAAGDCGVDQLPLTQPGQLTVATGEPVFEPWMVDDDPSNQEGFESALVYELAEEMGFAAEDVTWVRTGFDEAIAPGPKEYDFNIQQYSITAERDEVVDFSTGYYEVEQALVAAEDSSVADAESLADLTDARLGAAIGTTSLDYVEQVIAPSQQVAVFDDNAAAKAAFDAGQVDGLVFDLPTAFFITAVEIPDASIVGVLPRVGEDSEELGLLFEEGSELVGCVDQALTALHDDGTIEQLESQWLDAGGDVPTLTP